MLNLNAIFVIWRECFEVVLVVGILYAYLKRNGEGSSALRYLGSGIALGIGLSVVLAYGFQKAQSELAGRMLEFFQIGMLVLAALLMTQMCIWMKTHARTIRSELEEDLSRSLRRSQLLGITLLAMLSVAREGCEIVVFLYGLRIEAGQAGAVPQLVAAAIVGMGLTVLTAYAFYRGLKIFNPRWFFGVTSIFLLLTSSSMLLLATRNLIQMDAIPALKDMIWNTSFLLDERSSAGQFISGLTGYESTPSLMLVLVAAAYWIVTLYFYRRKTKSPTSTRKSNPKGTAFCVKIC